MSEGWISLHRKMLNWEWWDDHNVFRLFTYFLLKVNYEDKKWRGTTIKAGSIVTTYETLEKETGLTKSQIRTAIKKLKSTRDIAHETNSKYSIISISKWGEYQRKSHTNDTQHDTPVAHQSQADDRPMTTTKQSNNIYNPPIVPPLEETSEEASERRRKENAEREKAKVYFDGRAFHPDEYPLNPDVYRIIKLTARDLVAWKDRFNCLPLVPMLRQREEFLQSLSECDSRRKRWFITTENWLNSEQKAFLKQRGEVA